MGQAEDLDKIAPVSGIVLVMFCGALAAVEWMSAEGRLTDDLLWSIAKISMFLRESMNSIA